MNLLSNRYIPIFLSAKRSLASWMNLLGAKLRGIFAKFSEAFHPPSPRLRRVLLTFILAASCEVFGEGE